jgi:hypothetical protein
MTEPVKTAAADRWDALRADPDYAAAVAIAKAARQAAEKGRLEAMRATRAIQYLLLASEAASRQMWSLESLPDEQSEALEKATGDCAHCWFDAWSTAEDKAQDAAMDAALKAGQSIRAYRRAVATVETTAAAIDPIKEAALARIDKAAA